MIIKQIAIDEALELHKRGLMVGVLQPVVPEPKNLDDYEFLTLKKILDGCEFFRIVLEEEKRETEPAEKEPAEAAEPNDEEQDTFPEIPPSAQKIKYSGFMHIKCPECGAVKSFCMKQAADHYHCDSCKARSEFGDHMVPLFVHCECGGRHKYVTNRDDKSFDIECLDCGAPVAVEWNDKKKVYATIREK